jgi:hypothetical protein
MTRAEKAGMMLIATNNPDCGGGISERGRDLIDNQQMTRFILRARVTVMIVTLPLARLLDSAVPEMLPPLAAMVKSFGALPPENWTVLS